ncbi:MAG: aminotransferase class V-fold PLP-dependent enzyme [Saprospiraceae bacterium]
MAEEAVSIARRQVADLLQADDKEIIFTSGATEACNLAIKGVYEAYRRSGQHIITVQTSIMPYWTPAAIWKKRVPK